MSNVVAPKQALLADGRKFKELRVLTAKFLATRSGLMGSFTPADTKRIRELIGEVFWLNDKTQPMARSMDRVLPSKSAAEMARRDAARAGKALEIFPYRY